MTPIDLFKLIPKYDVDKGGDVYVHYIQLYQDLINDLIASNEDIYTIFDCINCAEKYLPYLAELLGYTWNYTVSWVTNYIYTFGATVIDNGKTYRCILAHTSGSHDDEPGIGAVWSTYWVETEDNTERQRYELLSIVQRRKRVGTLWFFDDLFRIMGVTTETRDLVHHVLTLSGPETLSDDFYMEGLEKYHEGAMEIIIDHAEIPGLYDLIRSAFPAGIQLHVTFNA